MNMSVILRKGMYRHEVEATYLPLREVLRVAERNAIDGDLDAELTTLALVSVGIRERLQTLGQLVDVKTTSPGKTRRRRP